jgi:hypothetical protein
MGPRLLAAKGFAVVVKILVNEESGGGIFGERKEKKGKWKKKVVNFILYGH